MNEMPDFGKIIFVSKERKDLQQILCNASKQELKFLECFLKYGKRPNAKELLENEYFSSEPLMASIFECNLAKREQDDSDFSYFNLIKN